MSQRGGGDADNRQDVVTRQVCCLCGSQRSILIKAALSGMIGGFMGGILAYFLSQQIAHLIAVPKPEPPSYFQTIIDSPDTFVLDVMELYNIYIIIKSIFLTDLM
ncbi:uncharacterized protein LOC109607938 [Aethina tumida]|uniref:uncharacterized protein LOC109607938 n=1 Tax=Aethina tumida TaxID=116153 RepID=UPI00096AF83D|nr:uncharacterized protein LOC109607938 [Aethina tumida]